MIDTTTVKFLLNIHYASTVATIIQLLTYADAKIRED